nr:MAG TPA: hypothetical protein [Caudoviricetes sp.]
MNYILRLQEHLVKCSLEINRLLIYVDKLTLMQHLIHK